MLGKRATCERLVNVTAAYVSCLALVFVALGEIVEGIAPAVVSCTHCMCSVCWAGVCLLGLSAVLPSKLHLLRLLAATDVLVVFVAPAALESILFCLF